MASVLGSGYDQQLVGNEELRARQVLLDMQDLLSRDPYEALGLIPSATAADIRNAFLTRTKQFHPARFGRMANDIQRLANEVFLMLRTAHDNLARPSVKAPAPRAGTAIPAAARSPAGTGSTPAQPTQAQGVATGTGGFRPPGQQPPRPPTGSPPIAARPSATPAPTTPITRTGPTRPGMPGATPASSAARPSPPAAPSSQTTQPLPIRTAAPRGPGQPAQPSRFASPSPQPPSVVRAGPQSGARPTGPAPAPAQPAARPVAGVERELVPIFELFAQDQLAAARVALETLVGRAPQSTRYKSLLAYAKGRAAQLDKRIDEARVELNEALQLDPGLQLAKTALTELIRGRR